MISICICSINARYDTDQLIHMLHRHNSDTEFEICLAHDNRIEDGSARHFEELRRKFPNLKVITNSYEDTVEWVYRVIDYYDTTGLFKPQFRRALRKNADLFAKKQLFDHAKFFLWISSGMLYNKAVSIASGDILIIHPGDFLYLFELSRLSNFVQENARDGRFYSSPNAVFARVSNANLEWLTQHVKDVHDGRCFHEGFRWDSEEVFRDYMECPCPLDRYYLCDFYHNKLINFADSDFISQARKYIQDCFTHKGVQVAHGFHGYHVMTRKSYDAIGGFTEEYLGRAFADDKMSSLGTREPGLNPLPAEFSILWCKQHEIAAFIGECYKTGWEEKLRDLRLLLPDPKIYLHHRIVDDLTMVGILNSSLNRTTPPVRLVT